MRLTRVPQMDKGNSQARSFFVDVTSVTLSFQCHSMGDKVCA